MSGNLKGETSAQRTRLVNAFLDAARLAKDDAVYLFIDEAQQMRDMEVGFLKDLYNALELQKVQLVTFLFGQNPGLSDAVNGFKNAKREDLVARFACYDTRLRSFSTLTDIAHLLNQIDCTVDENGRPYTEFFFPTAYANGYRLVCEASQLYSAMKRVMTGGEQYGFPARQVFYAIQDFFAFELDKDAPDFRGSAKQWDIAVANSALKAMLNHKQSTPSACSGLQLALPQTSDSDSPTSAETD
jgi:hypothetical protein